MFKIINNDKVFFSNSRETILDSAKAQNIDIDYSCSDGRCGKCVCYLESGEVVEKKGLDKNVINSPSLIKACLSYPNTDIKISSNNKRNRKNNLRFPTKISSLDIVNPDLVKIKLRYPPNNKLILNPGDYLEITGPEFITRSYTVANNFIDSNELELFVSKIKNGVFSKYWFEDAKIGDLLRCNGPTGESLITEFKNREVFCGLTGSGIAPIWFYLNRLKFLNKNEIAKSLTIFWGNRYSENIFLNFEEFKYIENLNINLVLSRENRIQSIKQGYVQDFLFQHVKKSSRPLIYACGNPLMIENLRQKCNELSILDFISDAFVDT